MIAQDLTYYGLDLYKKRNLAELLERLVKVEGIDKGSGWFCLPYRFSNGHEESMRMSEGSCFS